MKRLLALAIVATLCGCAGSGDNPLGTPLPPPDVRRTASGDCSNEYVEERNGIIEKVNLAALEVSSINSMNRYGTGTPDYAANKTKMLADLQQDVTALAAFLTGNGDLVCKAPVDTCKAAYKSDDLCLLKPEEYDETVQTINNDELQAALVSLRAFLAKNATPAP